MRGNSNHVVIISIHRTVTFIKPLLYFQSLKVSYTPSKRSLRNRWIGDHCIL